MTFPRDPNCPQQDWKPYDGITHACGVGFSMEFRGAMRSHPLCVGCKCFCHTIERGEQTTEHRCDVSVGDMKLLEDGTGFECKVCGQLWRDQP